MSKHLGKPLFFYLITYLLRWSQPTSFLPPLTGTNKILNVKYVRENNYKEKKIYEREYFIFIITIKIS